MQTSKRTPEQLAPIITQLQRIKVGMLITMFGISDFMANTRKDRLKVKSILPLEFQPAYVDAPRGQYRIGTVVAEGKRKEYYLDVDSSTLIFEGWDCPIKTDAEIMQGSFSGNACLNLGGVPIEELKQWIETRNLNPLFTSRDAVLFVKPLAGEDDKFRHDEGIPVYPDEPTAHAVVERVREKRATLAA